MKITSLEKRVKKCEKEIEASRHSMGRTRSLMEKSVSEHLANLAEKIRKKLPDEDSTGINKLSEAGHAKLNKRLTDDSEYARKFIPSDLAKKEEWSASLPSPDSMKKILRELINGWLGAIDQFLKELGLIEHEKFSDPQISTAKFPKKLSSLIKKYERQDQRRNRKIAKLEETKKQREQEIARAHLNQAK